MEKKCINIALKKQEKKNRFLKANLWHFQYKTQYDIDRPDVVVRIFFYFFFVGGNRWFAWFDSYDLFLVISWKSSSRRKTEYYCYA